MAAKVLSMLVMAMVLIGASACRSGATPTPTEPVLPPTSADTPTPPPTATLFQFVAGDYYGSDPDIVLVMTKDGDLRVAQFFITMTSKDGKSSWTCEPGWPLYQGYKTTLNPDGSFVFRDETGFLIINGKISGKTAHGTYAVENCSTGSTPEPKNGEWSASWAVTPTPQGLGTPLPTSIPPKPGYYHGINPQVSFEIKENREIVNFVISIPLPDGNTCDVKQDGVWHLDSYGHFLAYGEGSTTISGDVRRNSASGRYQAQKCGSTFMPGYVSGEWRADGPPFEYMPSPTGTVAPSLLTVYHRPNPSKFEQYSDKQHKYYCSYETSVTALNAGIIIQEFGMYSWESGEWKFGESFASADFSEWYSCPDAYIAPGQTCSDPENWNGADTLDVTRFKWFYRGIDDYGNEVLGDAVVECLP